MIIFLLLIIFVITLFLTDRIINAKYYSNPFFMIGIFGLPGSGKSTLGAMLAYKHFKKGWEVYSDDPSLNIPGIHYFDSEEFKKGNWLPRAMAHEKPVLLLFDEMSTLYLNRSFKTNMTPETLGWWKYHRHYRTKVIYLSQSWEDVDVVIRRLTDSYYLVKRSIFKLFILARKIDRKIDVKNDSVADDEAITKSSGGQICDYYDYASILKSKLCFLPKWVKKFDSFRAASESARAQ